MTRLIALNFWILSKVIYWLSIFFVVLETKAVTEARQYLYVKVTIDAKYCQEDVRWDLNQQIVFASLKDTSQLDLSGAGKYCGCKNGTSQLGCNGTSNKSVINLLYASNSGKINANGQLALLEAKLSNTSTVISQITLPKDVPAYYICSKLTIIPDTDADYKSCNNINAPFTNPSSAPGSAHSGKPGTATIVGAAVGSLAGLGLLAVLARVIYGIVKRANQVDDLASTSDISPIIPGFKGIGEAPNSVPPAGTN